MGDPKYPRRVWKKPKRPLNYELKMDELKTLGTFGLKTKRELWKAHTELSRVRHQARSLLALRQEDREKKEPVLMQALAKIGLVSRDSTLDDVLNLQVNDLLSRRLQTIVLKKLGFKTPYQARQAVVHGHIRIGDRKVNIPSYTVTLDEESKIEFTPESSIPDTLEKDTKSKASDGDDSAQETSGDRPDAPPVEAGKEAPASKDSAPEVKSDPKPDASSNDSAPEVKSEVAPDASSDSSQKVKSEVAPDASSDSSQKVKSEVAPDASSDSSQKVKSEVAPDTSNDSTVSKQDEPPHAQSQ